MELAKPKIFFIVSVGFAILLLVYVSQLSMLREQRHDGVYSVRNTSTLNATTSQGKKKLILVYTTFFGIKEWVPIEKTCPRESPCPIGEFEVTYDKQRFSDSNFVLFHARDMPTLSDLTALLKRKPYSQWWAYFLMESPNASPDTAPLNGFFNLTWTYRSDSDIPVPYGTYTEVLNENNDANSNALIQDFTQGKSKLVAWMVSNCGSPLRKQFVHQLQKYVQVDVFGSCSGEFGAPKSCPHEAQCNSIIKQYKFYLGFENALCEDYITEKYWGHLDSRENVVPVVLGGANYSKLAIPGSYINVMDFTTVKELAEYLQYLDKNNTAYNEYFTWRRTFVLSNGRSRLCEICAVFGLGTTPQPKVYNDLKTYWVEQGKCNEKDQIVRKMFQS